MQHVDRRLMRALAMAPAALAASLALVACGSDNANKPLPPSSTTPVAHKEPTLTPAEYPAMRDWIIDHPSSADGLRTVCVELDSAPDTPVVRATRNVCDRSLSIALDTAQAVANIVATAASRCAVGDYRCRADLLRGARNELVNFRRTVLTYDEDIRAAIAPGSCRDVLAPQDDLAKTDRYIKTFDEAVDGFAHGDPGALAALNGSDTQDIKDPTPCRPA